MNWTLKTESKDSETGCRNAIKDRPDSLYAGIYKDDGSGIVCIDRLGRRDGSDVWLHDQIADNDEPEFHATTDEEWQSIVRCIRAAPDLLAALRDCRDWLVAITDPNNNLDETYKGYLRAATEAIEKATGAAD